MEPGTINLNLKHAYRWLFFYEFLGTALFLIGINYSHGSVLVVGLSLFIAAMITGRVGGGHFNAGVTLAVYLIERKWKANCKPFWVIIFADILGAYTGIFIAIVLQ